MKIVTHKDLSNFKVLPYDLYSDTNNKILSAGEVLTPAKLILLRNYTKLYIEEPAESKPERNSEDSEIAKRMSSFSYDGLDIAEFDTVVNRLSVVKADTQIRVKYFMRKILDLFEQEYFEEGFMKLNQLVSVITTELFKYVLKSRKGSLVRFMGEYEICHPLNVAIISGLIARKLDYSSTDIEKILIAALLHDIGKFKIELDNGESPILTIHEVAVKDHPQIGYDIIKNKLNLEERIAKVALEHHENNDGSGYPSGVSSYYISEWAQIVNVANYYDNLACNRTSHYVSNNRDALRTMLEDGTKRFSARMLYSFVHRFSYDDADDFNEMLM